MARRELECFGGPLCGSMVPDTHELWLGMVSVKDERDTHYYKRVKMVDVLTGKSLLLWHYHGPDPLKPGMGPIRPAARKFR